MAVGDVSLGDHPVRVGHGTRSLFRRRPAPYPFGRVGDLLRQADFVCGNLETVLSDRSMWPPGLEADEMRGCPESVQVLSDTGFTMLNLANNHAMQHGPDAFRDTAARLRTHGIEPLGVRDEAGGVRVSEIVRDDWRIGLMGYSLCREKFAPGAALYSGGDAEALLAAVRALAPRWPTLVLSLHWGLEHVFGPSPGQLGLARALRQAGVTVILGHHPHVLQAVEPAGTGLIAYSLGNFVFDHHFRQSRHSAILDLTLTPEGVRAWRLQPVYIDRLSQPALLEGRRERRARRILEQRSAALSESRTALEEGPGSESLWLLRGARQYHRQRIYNYAYFVAHLYRYPPAVIWASLRRTVRRRIREIQREEQVL
jgi:poly-gamma-glutamate synthesis protein (capsule biosynthesis protein)